MEEEAIVISVHGENATVKIQRSGSCDGCSAKSSCATQSGGENITEAFNTIGAVPGQKVIVTVKPGVVLKASLIVYLLPLVFLIGGAIIGKEMAVSMGAAEQSDAWAATAGFSLMAVVFIAQRLWNKKVSTSREYLPHIVRIV